MSMRVLGVCYFLHAPVHLKHISKGSFQYFQYCELEDFPFQHLHFITHVRACVLEEKERKKVAEQERKDDHEQDVFQKVVSCQQRGNGINISNVHSSAFFGGEKTSSK